MKPIRTVLLALAAGAALGTLAHAQSGRPTGSAATAQAALRACSLLTDEQIKTLIYRGRRPDPQEEMTVGRGGSGSACSFSGGEQQLILFSGRRPRPISRRS